MQLQVWQDHLELRGHSGIQVSALGFWLTSDTTKPLPDSFTLTINARVFGLQVGSVTIDPVKDGPFAMPLLAKLGGTVDGRIDDWGAFDKNAKPVDSAHDPHWTAADAVGFSITGVADVTLTASAIAAVLPGLGWLAKAALAILGNRVTVSVAHQRVLAHLPHGSGSA